MTPTTLKQYLNSYNACIHRNRTAYTRTLISTALLSSLITLLITAIIADITLLQ